MTVNVTNIIIGLLLIASVISTPLLSWVATRLPRKVSSVRGADHSEAGHTGRRLKPRERLDGMNLHSNRATALAALVLSLSRS